MQIVIIGAGIAGVASAIALTKWLPEKPRITVLEVRSQPLTIGGAIGLTPNALRCLHHLGVLERIQEHKYGADVRSIELFNAYTGYSLGQLNFSGNDGQGLGTPLFKGLRILRSDLLNALLEIGRSLENVDFRYGSKVMSITEQSDSISTVTEVGTIYADMLIGCDGIHSVTRTYLIDPDRKPEYTGIAAVSGFSDPAQDLSTVWHDTALCQGQRGSLLSSYYEPSRKKQYVAVVMETKDVKSRQGWQAKGTEQDKTKANVKQRFGKSKMPGLDEIIEATSDWSLYPVYMLGPSGRWCSKRAILLGDAAHAMPPQGESAAIALEDAVVFARVLAHHQGKEPTMAFTAYEGVRRPRVDKAYQEATFGWNTQKDSSWLAFQMKVWLTSAFLWWTAAARLKRYTEDLATIELDLD